MTFKTCVALAPFNQINGGSSIFEFKLYKYIGCKEQDEAL